MEEILDILMRFLKGKDATCMLLAKRDKLQVFRNQRVSLAYCCTTEDNIQVRRAQRDIMLPEKLLRTLLRILENKTLPFFTGGACLVGGKSGRIWPGWRQIGKCNCYLEASGKGMHAWQTVIKLNYIGYTTRP